MSYLWAVSSDLPRCFQEGEVAESNTLGRVEEFQTRLATSVGAAKAQELIHSQEDTQGQDQGAEEVQGDGEWGSLAQEANGRVRKGVPQAPAWGGARKTPWWESEKILTVVLMDAEEEYHRNIRKQKAVMGGGNPPWARDSPPPGAPPGPSPFTFMDRVFVPLYSCAAEYRLGAWGDGGKWVCLSHYRSSNAEPVVVSIGSNGDTSFEADVQNILQVPSHTLDFSLLPDVVDQVSSLEFIKFFPVGLTGSSEKKKLQKLFFKSHRQWFTFLTVDQMLEHIGQKYVDIFKVDCELCEYDVVRDMGRLYTRDTVPFGQLQIELHRCADIGLTTELTRTLANLGFRLFHTEINLYGAGFNQWQYEVSYIHESLVSPRL